MKKKALKFRHTSGAERIAWLPRTQESRVLVARKGAEICVPLSLFNSIYELSAILFSYEAKSGLLDFNPRIQCAFATPHVVFVPILTVKNVNKDFQRNEKKLEFLHTSVGEWIAWLLPRP